MLNIMIKPASGLCNLSCQYCFYRDIAENRQIKSYGIMSTETLETVVRRIFEYASTACTVAWQGGEPTLAGLDFYKAYIRLEEQYNLRRLPVRRILQTNGYALDDSWCRFLAENHFLVGLSLDGDRVSHDKNRVTPQNQGTFSRISETARLLQRHGVDFNILTVVNQITAARIENIYSYYQQQGFLYQQYIACLDPLGCKPGQTPWSLTPEVYGRFLIDLFRLWLEDCKRGNAPYIRQFDNWIGILQGFPPDACEQQGICSCQTVIEADGSVYPCDFYVTDCWRLGSLTQHRLDVLDFHPLREKFIARSAIIPKACRKCPYAMLCRNGCCRQRTQPDGRNCFCESYRMFFDQCLPQLRQLADFRPEI